MAKLTGQQEKAFQFIRKRGLIAGSAPTLRELCDYMGFSAVGSAQDVVAALRRKGFLRPVDKRASRNLLLTEQGKVYGLAANKGEQDIDVYSDSYLVPCLGAVPAGSPLEAIEEKVGTLKVSASLFAAPRPQPDRLYALKAQGLSMVGAGILDGDWLVVNSQHGANDGNIVVARIDGDVTVKKLKHDSRDGWYLNPENPAFSPLYAKDKPFEIIGRVIALQRMIAP